MSFKDKVAEQGAKLLQDSRVNRVMQNEHVMKGVVKALQVRTQAQQSVADHVQKAAKRFGLATKQEVREMKRTVRKLETKIRKTESEKTSTARGRT